MEILVTALPVDQFPDDPIALPIFVDARPPRREAGRVNFRLGGQISAWIDKGELDPGSPTPLLFSPGAGKPFPLLVIAGGGYFEELSAPQIERTIAALAEALLRTGTPAFSIAARDFKKPMTAPRDSAEIVLRGLAHGADRAGKTTGSRIRIHWEEEDIDVFIQEMKLFRHHHQNTRDWNIGRDPEDEIRFAR